jgi:hypothetical protein
MSETNPYLALMVDDEEPKKKVSKPVATQSVPITTSQNPPVQNEVLSPELLKALEVYGVRSPLSSIPAENSTPAASAPNEPASAANNANPYVSLLGDEDYNQSFTGAPVGLTGGVRMNPSVAGTFAESMTGAPAGSVAQINQLMKPTSSTMTPAIAARMAAEARSPSMMPNSSGANWLKNWANQPSEGFTGGVPEAAGHYERGKWHGKISGRIKKLYPHGLTGEGAAAAEANQAAQEAARAAQVAKEAQSSATASRWTAPLSSAARVIGVAGAGAGLYDAYNRFMNQDKTGAGLAIGLTGLSAMAPGYGPLSAAAMQLYDDPESRRKFLEGLSGQGAFSNRGRFGLD